MIVFRGSRKSEREDDDTGPETNGEHAKANGKQDPQKDDARTDTGCDLDLAYAVTCHKLQGSQAPIVIVCLDEYPGEQVSSASVIVPGSTPHSARKAVFAIGMKHVADGMCRRTFINRRKTWMSETIRQLAAKAGVRLSIRETDLW